MVSSPASEGSLLLDNIRISLHLRKSKKFIKQSQKLENCCKNFEVFIDWENQKFVEFGKRCGYRICLYCSKIRSSFYYNQFIEFIQKINIPRD